VPAHRPWLAAEARPWPGQLAVVRSAGLDGFTLLTTIDARARMGRLAAALFPGPLSVFDTGNTLLVDMDSGTLEGITDLELFGGANAFAVESSPGRWEVLQAAIVELVAVGRYSLTRLLRGQRGTEGAMGAPTPVGARIVTLVAEADLFLDWNWRIGPAVRDIADATYAAAAFTPAGRGLLPFAPVHVEQPWRTGRLPGDLTIRWVRRSRDLSADAWEIGEQPLSEATEAYEIDIYNGSTLKRTLTTGTPSALYTAAQQIADFGAPLGPGQSFTVRIFQISARLGRGSEAITTLFT
jgi:hypothetical protein